TQWRAGPLPQARAVRPSAAPHVQGADDPGHAARSHGDLARGRRGPARADLGRPGAARSPRWRPHRIGVGRRCELQERAARCHTHGVLPAMRGGPALLSPHALYPLVQAWLQALELPCPPLALTALAHLVLALLTAQSLRPSALMRALLSPV